MKKTAFVSSRMRFGICILDAMGHMHALACTTTIELARSIASAMANDLNLSTYYSPNKRPLLYVYDDEGRNYGSF